MKIAICELQSESPISFSKFVNVSKNVGETHAQHEERTWREKLHVNDDGYVIIPPMMFKNALSQAASYLGIQRPGKGKRTFLKHFEAGIMVTEPLILDLKKEDVQGEWLYVPSDGRRGGTTRVEKMFPIIPSWKGTVKFYIIDETVMEQLPDKNGKAAFEYHLEEAGKFIGLGRFRPRNNGYYGRFKVVSIKYLDE
jgi:hypothetical protein